MRNNRLDELDLLRGLSVLGMILVITPGEWGSSYHWLNHADWEGLVAVDMIAPGFLFCVGFAIPLTLQNRISQGYSSVKIVGQIFQRGALLILFGLLVHWLEKFDVSSLRIPGVLQRIGLTYIIVATSVLYLGRKSERGFEPNLRVLYGISTLILVGLWLWFYLIPVPNHGANQFSSDGSWASYIDQNVFGVDHLWEWGQTDGIVTYDPDGLLCSLATCVNVLIGVIIGVMYQKKSRHYKKIKLIGLAIAMISLGLLVSPICPIIKKIWTSSFVLISSGFSLLTFVLLSYLKESTVFRTLSHPLYCYGANALIAFAVSWLGLFWYLNVPIFDDNSLRSIGFNFFNHLVSSKALASFLFGMLFVFLLYTLLAWMHHKRWYWRL